MTGIRLNGMYQSCEVIIAPVDHHMSDFCPQ